MASVLRFDEWQDSDGNAVASGAGGVFTSPGSILQVVQSVYSTSATISTATLTDTGLSASITPSSASNKILVVVNQIGFADDIATLGYDVFHNIVRDSTTVYETSTSLRSKNNTDTTRFPIGGTLSFLDSPATTSSITYKTQGAIGASGDNLVFQNGNKDSSITLMEVAG